MRTLFAAALISLSIMTPAFADDWRTVVNGDDGTNIQIDADSVVAINGGVEYTYSIISPKEDKYMLVRSQMLCYKRRWRIVAYRAFDSNGNLIKARNISNDEFDPIVVNSMKAAEWEFLCHQ